MDTLRVATTDPLVVTIGALICGARPVALDALPDGRCRVVLDGVTPEELAAKVAVFQHLIHAQALVSDFLRLEGQRQRLGRDEAVVI